MWPRWRKDKADSSLEAISVIVKEMNYDDLNECWRLDQRCFTDGEAYDRETIRYLLSHNHSICFKVVDISDEMTAFIVGMVEPDGIGHVVAVGVSPEHRRKGQGRLLMDVVEKGFRERGVNTIRLEVRTSNIIAQNLYHDLGFKIIRRMPHYYTSGDDGYLMIKNL